MSSEISLYILYVNPLSGMCISRLFLFFFFLQMDWRVHEWKQLYNLNDKCSDQGKMSSVSLRKWFWIEEIWIGLKDIDRQNQ